MIDALVHAKLYEPGRERTASATGRRYVTAKALTSVGNGTSVFVNLVSFDPSTSAALLALHCGDAVALAGTLKPGAWLDRDGNARPALDLVVSAVMTPYAARRKRDALAGHQTSAASESEAAARTHASDPDLDPEDDAWLAGGEA